MFDLERFIAECEAAVVAGGQEAVREVVQRAIADPEGIIKALGEPKRAAALPLHRSPRLTILHVLWPPNHTQAPHNHLLWAEVGVYTGREDSILWRRCPPGATSQIEAMGAASVSAGRHVSLPHDAIHSVNNPLDRLTAGLHVYGGDLAGMQRSMWEAETLAEVPLSHARDLRAIDAFNATVEKAGLGEPLSSAGRPS
jgi:predicted metal-dependent enzyme (double-stranded beta helix superfamily)